MLDQFKIKAYVLFVFVRRVRAIANTIIPLD